MPHSKTKERPLCSESVRAFKHRGRASKPTCTRRDLWLNLSESDHVVPVTPRNLMGWIGHILYLYIGHNSQMIVGCPVVCSLLIYE